MTLSESFNEHTRSRKISDYAINVYSENCSHRFDFIMRTVRIIENADSGARLGSTVLPFSQLDREVLETVRNKLIDLGGKPPELAPAQPPEPPKGKGLQL